MGFAPPNPGPQKRVERSRSPPLPPCAAACRAGRRLSSNHPNLSRNPKQRRLPSSQKIRAKARARGRAQTTRCPRCPPRCFAAAGGTRDGEIRITKVEIRNKFEIRTNDRQSTGTFHILALEFVSSFSLTPQRSNGSTICSKYLSGTSLYLARPTSLNPHFA